MVLFEQIRMATSHSTTALVAIALCMLPGCRKPTDVSRSVVANSGTSAGALTAAPTAAFGAPGNSSVLPSAVALPVGFEARAFEPARYVTVVGLLLHGTHALQVLSEDSTAFLSLDLKADGSATAMRGWRARTRNDGPKVHSQANYREQQGYRGTFAIQADAIEVRLRLDNNVCAPIFQGDDRVERMAEVALRCFRAVAMPALGLGDTPLLLCQVEDARSPEFEAQMVKSIAGDGWFLLGGGNGLVVQLTGRPIAARAGAPIRSVARVARAPLMLSAWENRLPAEL
jgi:hypothetical protein